MKNIINVMLISILYSRSFLLLMITLSIPVALSSSLISVPYSISYSTHLIQTTNLNISMELYKFNNKNIMIFGSKNESYLLSYLNLNIITGKEGVLISGNLNKEVNSTISLCLNDGCKAYNISGIITSPYNITLIILPFNFNATQISLTNNGVNLALIGSSLSLIKLVLLLSIIILIFSIPAQVFSYEKMVNNMESTFANLKTMGLSKNNIIFYFIISSLIVSSLIILYGISLGIFIYQLGLFFLSRLNLVLPYGIPDPLIISLLFFISILTSLLSSLISIGERIDKISI
ncbi:putative permease [Caldisphaera lagunensis DSM 15908]|uniref:Putative permease n=1 Tax=Caldisphaera lagunensis (strain DSM 15908 / JCM 11604 / ANMR 0165 / IC-154) TaxID=1056495 RepID=L0A9Z2_CALLD|nr:permease [Caldisphaera lagunensis]AFZ70671.1 putative permease [Caldisphaera lagunensis DSM 15908]